MKKRLVNPRSAAARASAALCLVLALAPALSHSMSLCTGPFSSPGAGAAAEPQPLTLAELVPLLGEPASTAQLKGLFRTGFELETPQEVFQNITHWFDWARFEREITAEERARIFADLEREGLLEQYILDDQARADLAARDPELFAELTQGLTLARLEIAAATDEEAKALAAGQDPRAQAKPRAPAPGLSSGGILLPGGATSTGLEIARSDEEKRGEFTRGASGILLPSATGLRQAGSDPAPVGLQQATRTAQGLEIPAATQYQLLRSRWMALSPERRAAAVRLASLSAKGKAQAIASLHTDPRSKSRRIAEVLFADRSPGHAPAWFADHVAWDFERPGIVEFKVREDLVIDDPVLTTQILVSLAQAMGVWHQLQHPEETPIFPVTLHMHASLIGQPEISQEELEGRARLSNLLTLLMNLVSRPEDDSAAMAKTYSFTTNIFDKGLVRVVLPDDRLSSDDLPPEFQRRVEFRTRFAAPNLSFAYNLGWLMSSQDELRRRVGSVLAAHPELIDRLAGVRPEALLGPLADLIPESLWPRVESALTGTTPETIASALSGSLNNRLAYRILRQASLGDPSRFAAITAALALTQPMSADRSRLLVRSQDQRAWQVRSYPEGNVIAALPAAKEDIGYLSPDGKRVALQTVEDHLRRIAEYDNGRYAATISAMISLSASSMPIRVFDVGKPKPIATLNPVFIISPIALAFSPDGKQVAAVDQNGSVVLWKSRVTLLDHVIDLPNKGRMFHETGRRVLVLDRSRAFGDDSDDTADFSHRIGWSADGKKIVVVSADNGINVYDAKSGKWESRQTFEGLGSSAPKLLSSLGRFTTVQPGSTEGTYVTGSWSADTGTVERVRLPAPAKP